MTDTLILCMHLGLGLLLGFCLGFIINSALGAKRLRHANRSSWAAARRYYERAYILTPRD